MMKTKAFAFFTLAVLVLNLSGLALADTRRSKSKKRQSNALVAMLPASDGVVTFDAKRFFNDALPKVISANQPMLGETMSHIGEIERKTGIDIRKFEQVAVGITLKTGAKNNLDVDPVVIARGDFSADSLIATAKAAAQGKYRLVLIGNRSVLVFPAKEMAKKTVPAAAIPAGTDVADTVIDGMPDEIALMSLDSTTLLIGSPLRVRQTLERQTSVAAEITALLSNSETSVCTFAMRVPEKMATLVDLEKDELGKNINSIKYMSGSMDVTVAGASMALMARTAKPEQAKELFDMLQGLQMIGKSFLGGSKKTEHKVIARMLDTAKVTNRGTDVLLNVSVAQADIDLLVATIK